MRRIWYLFLLAAMSALGQPGSPDPAFEKIPFDNWLKGSGQARMRWSMRVFPPSLSEHQRLETYIWAVVDADEFVKRAKRGQMMLFLEIRDRDNRTFRIHRTLGLGRRTNPADLVALRFVDHACIVPGDYEVAAAVYDTQSKEHSLKRTKLRVPDLARDPLPDAWRDLPSVEFSGCGPVNSARLSLPLQTEKPVRIEVVMNQSVNRNKTAGSVLAQMNPLIARLEVISEMEVRNGSMNVTLLDLERRKVTFTGKVVDKAIRRRLGPALRENDPYKIDAHALENRNENAQFFVSEIGKRLENTTDAEPVIIVLSAPLEFPKGEDLRPIQAPPPGSRVFYIRCNSPVYAPAVVPPQLPSPGPVAPPILPSSPSVRMEHYANNSDSLAGTLKPLHPRLFDVTTPTEFRNALAAIMTDISQPPPR
jgi:hypothetical protein